MRLAKSMKQDTPDHDITNSCPCCSYTLEREDDQEYDILFSLDGNNSAKHVEPKHYERDENGKVLSSRNIERETGKVFETPFYLTEDVVNGFANEVKSRRVSSFVSIRND
jgi:hypothetical protein